ncbi:hypothetical protein YC2023_116004 [Brassica napus]
MYHCGVNLYWYSSHPELGEGISHYKMRNEYVVDLYAPIDKPEGFSKKKPQRHLRKSESVKMEKRERFVLEVL